MLRATSRTFVAMFFASVLMLSSMASVALADEPGDVRGCWAVYNSQTGKFLYEPFLKVDHPKTWASEYGFPEVWGYRTWNLEDPEEDGTTKVVNILESQFIEMGKNKEVQLYRNDDKQKKATRCPDGLW